MECSPLPCCPRATARTASVRAEDAYGLAMNRVPGGSSPGLGRTRPDPIRMPTPGDHSCTVCARPRPKTVQRARHVHVREQHLHIGACFEKSQRLLSVRALQDGEAGVFEHVSRDHAHEHFVLDKEDHERVVHRCMLLPWSSSVPQPAVIRSLGKCREDPGTAMKSPAGNADRANSYKRPSGCEGAENESGQKPSKPSPYWAGFLSAAVFWRRVLSRTSALSSSVSLEVSMARLGSATNSRTTATRR